MVEVLIGGDEVLVGSRQIRRPSMPPSMEIHSPLIWPAAWWEARKAIALATSEGWAILRRGTLGEAQC